MSFQEGSADSYGPSPVISPPYYFLYNAKKNQQARRSFTISFQPATPAFHLFSLRFELWCFNMSIICFQSHFRFTADLFWRHLNNWKQLSEQLSLPFPTQQNIIYSHTVSHSSAGDWNGRFVLQPMKYWMEIHIQKTCKSKTCYEKKNAKNKDVTILKSQGIFCIFLFEFLKC